MFYVFAVVGDAGGGAEAFVVGVFDDGADVDVGGHVAFAAGEVEGAFGLGVGGEPVLAVYLFVVGGEGRGEVFVVFAFVVGDVFAVDEDDLEVLLVDPDLALEVAVIFDDDLGAGLEDVGVQLVDFLAAEVGDVVFGEVGGGEDEGEAVLDVLEVCGGHGDAGEGVLRGEDYVFCALAFAGEGDVSDLLVLAVDLVGVLRDGLDFDGLAEGVILAGGVEVGFAGGEFFDNLRGGEAGGRCWVEWAEASGVLLGGGC